MFERNKIENSPPTAAVPVAITFANGSVEKGKLFTVVGRSLHDGLNNAAPFVEFEPYGGTRKFIAKAQVAAIELIGIPPSKNLPKISDNTNFDPYAVLGLARQANRVEIRNAYIEKAKRYHPDLFSSQELPAEVQEYLSATARRVNLAYELLETAEKARVQTQAAKSEPIFTS